MADLATERRGVAASLVPPGTSCSAAWCSVPPCGSSFAPAAATPDLLVRGGDGGGLREARAQRHDAEASDAAPAEELAAEG